MIKQGVNKFRVMAAASLVVLALASAPAKAHNGNNYVAPLAAFIAFSALVHHGQHRHRHHHRYRGHGGHYGHRPRRHSHSQGGYHNPRHKRHNNW